MIRTQNTKAGQVSAWYSRGKYHVRYKGRTFSASTPGALKGGVASNLNAANNLPWWAKKALRAAAFALIDALVKVVKDKLRGKKTSTKKTSTKKTSTKKTYRRR